MPKQLCDDDEIGSASNERRGKGVPENVSSRIGLQSRLLGDRCDHVARTSHRLRLHLP